MHLNHDTDSMLSVRFATLTNREKEILNLIFEENTSKTIAIQLSISNRTVDRHRENLIAKFGVKNTVGLIKTCHPIFSNKNEPIYDKNHYKLTKNG